MKHKNRFYPPMAIPPGETLFELLNVNGFTANKLAVKLDLSLDEMDKLLKGEIAIDENIAENIEQALGIKKQFWLNLEQNYRNTLIRLSQETIPEAPVLKNVSKEINELINQQEILSKKLNKIIDYTIMLENVIDKFVEITRYSPPRMLAMQQCINSIREMYQPIEIKKHQRK